MNFKRANDMLTSFFASGSELRLDAKEPIIQIGEISQNAYWIQSGVIKVFSYDDSGAEQIHYLYKAHELFPVTTLFDHTTKSVGFAAFTSAVIRVRSIADTRTFLQ